MWLAETNGQSHFGPSGRSVHAFWALRAGRRECARAKSRASKTHYGAMSRASYPPALQPSNAYAYKHLATRIHICVCHCVTALLGGKPGRPLVYTAVWSWRTYEMNSACGLSRQLVLRSVCSRASHVPGVRVVRARRVIRPSWQSSLFPRPIVGVVPEGIPKAPGVKIHQGCPLSWIWRTKMRGATPLLAFAPRPVACVLYMGPAFT